MVKTTEGYRHAKKGESNYINAFLVGKIPFDSIERINWEGDEHYNYPHIFCYFENKTKEPYDELVYCTEFSNSIEIKHYSEITKYADVISLNKKHKITNYC